MTTKTETQESVVVHFNAGNDKNGNPRRVYVAIRTDGVIVGAWDEGYRGAGAVPTEYHSKAVAAPVFMITPKEYRDCLAGSCAFEPKERPTQ